MGVIYETIQRPNLYDYEREYNKDGTEKHICCDGARYHVLSYSFGRKDGEPYSKVRCSEPNCEVNRDG